MSNIGKYQRHIQNLSSNNETTISFILDEIKKLSQVDKIKEIVEIILIKNVRGLKYKLPLRRISRTITNC